MNHPTVVFRRDLALAVGGYPHLRSMQDYALFIDLMAAGARFGNVAESMVRFRADDSMRARRSGVRRHWRHEIEVRRRLASLPEVGPVSSRAVLLGRLAARASPTRLVTGVSNAVLTRSEG
jgi:hypothetical protein